MNLGNAASVTDPNQSNLKVFHSLYVMRNTGLTGTFPSLWIRGDSVPATGLVYIRNLPGRPKGFMNTSNDEPCLR